MNLDRLREELEIDEGCKYEIYLDQLGYPTFGIGHLITENDPEYGWEVGASIDTVRVHETFESDIEGVLSDCSKLYSDFEDLPEEAQRVIANMMFNMGYTRLSKFKNMKLSVDDRNWDIAADEMVDSRWYYQVPNRAKRLVERMRNIE